MDDYNGEIEFRPKINCLLISLTLLAVISGFLYGYDTGIVSGAMVILKTDMGLNNLWQELIISSTLGTAALSSFFSGSLNGRFGRKRVLVGSSLVFIIGTIVLVISQNKETLLVGRIILGFAIGSSSSTTPAYIAECSPPTVRGRLLNTFQVAMTCGFWIAAITASLLSYVKIPDLNWRLMMAVGAIPPLVQAVGFIFMPESPRWLVLKNRVDEAKKVVARIYGGGEEAQELAEHDVKVIQQSEEAAQFELVKLGIQGKSILLTMLRTPHLRKGLIIGCSMQMFQQLCGVNTVNYYGATIIMMSGIQNRTIAIWLTTLTSGVKFLSSFIGFYLVDKIGRRLLLFISITGVFLSLLLLGTAFSLIAAGSPKSMLVEHDEFNSTTKCDNRGCDSCSYVDSCGFCYETSHPASTGACVLKGSNSQYAAYGRCSRGPNSTDDNIMFEDPNVTWNFGYCPAKMSWLPILAMVLYLMSFASGYAPVPWIINAEIYPNWARSTGNAMSTTFNYGFNLLISLTFLTLAEAVTRQGAFFIYAGLTLIASVWFYFVVPETKNKEIEEIQQLLKEPWFARKPLFRK